MNNYLRQGLADLTPYDPGEEVHVYKMDANECPWDLPKSIREILAKELVSGSNLNIYPDSDANTLRQAIGEYCKVPPNNIIVGSGSDELIGLLATAFIDRGDSVLYPTPSFGMYRIFTLIAGARPVEVPLGKEYEYDIDAFKRKIEGYRPKLLFLCSPNNPTGNNIDLDDAKKLIREFPGVVVMDEAYMEFTKMTMVDCVEEFPNLVILRTFSKAFGLAGLRVGYCISNSDLIGQIRRVKPPYNINSLSQRAAILALEHMDTMKNRINEIIKQREFLCESLMAIPSLKVYPSEANFLLVRTPNGDTIWNKLLNKGFLVRNFSNHPYLKNCLRISVAEEAINIKFINELTDILKGMKGEICHD